MCRAVKHLPPPTARFPDALPRTQGGRWRARYCRHVGSPLTNRTHLLPSFVRLGRVRGWGSGRGWCQSLKGFSKKRKKEKIKKQKKEEKKNTRLLIRQSQVRSQFELYWSLAWSGRPSVSSPRPARRRNQGQDTNFSPLRPVTEHQG